MDKLKRELFSTKNKSFKVNELLNSILKPDQTIDDEILIFKLKLIQREFSTEIDSNMNKFLNFSKSLDEELRNFNQTNTNYISRVREITTQTNISDKR